MILTTKSDNLGMLISTLCFIHCLATPFLFIVHTCSVTCCETTPIWWKGFDYLFLAIAFFAIRRSTQLGTNNSIKLGLWISWIVLLIVIITENIGLYHLSETYKFIAALTLVVLHLYNQKYCQCRNDKCCIYNE